MPSRLPQKCQVNLHKLNKECKLGSRDIEEGASHLLKLKSLIQKYNSEQPQIRLREPDLMLVLTGGQLAYRRNDGVCVVPIGCLKP